MTLTYYSQSAFNFSVWLREHNILNNEEIYFIKKFHCLYKAIIFQGLEKTIGKETPDSKKNKTTWIALTRLVKYNPSVFKALKLLGQPRLSGQDILYISRHLHSMRFLIRSIKKLL